MFPVPFPLCSACLLGTMGEPGALRSNAVGPRLPWDGAPAADSSVSYVVKVCLSWISAITAQIHWAVFFPHLENLFTPHSVQTSVLSGERPSGLSVLVGVVCICFFQHVSVFRAPHPGFLTHHDARIHKLHVAKSNGGFPIPTGLYSAWPSVTFDIWILHSSLPHLVS